MKDMGSEMLLTTTHYFVFRTALLAKPKPAKPSSNQTIHGEICENKHGKNAPLCQEDAIEFRIHI